MKKSQLLIGAHTSAAGGVQNALYQGQEIGANTIQLFTANQRQWHSGLIPEATIEAWKLALEETGITSVMSHSSYLINLGSSDPVNLLKSSQAFQMEIPTLQTDNSRCLLHKHLS